MNKYFFFTVDTEIDKSPNWKIAKSNYFDSINYGVKKLLYPLLSKYNIKSTFLLSPEVLEDNHTVEILKSIQTPETEFGTHLHSEFIEPQRSLFKYNMGGNLADKFQNEYNKEIEFLKLKNLTNIFKEKFNYNPLSFRAGRYAKSSFTNKFLIELGYKVDSSITPGLKWKNNSAIVDYSYHNNDLKIIKNNNNLLYCLPISIHNKNIYFNRLFYNDKIYSKIICKIFKKYVGYDWLRPAYNKQFNLDFFFNKYHQEFYVFIMHSNELGLNTSPYIKNNIDLNKLLNCLENLFKYINAHQIKSKNLKDIVKII